MFAYARVFVRLIYGVDSVDYTRPFASLVNAFSMLLVLLLMVQTRMLASLHCVPPALGPPPRSSPTSLPVYFLTCCPPY